MERVRAHNIAGTKYWTLRLHRADGSTVTPIGWDGCRIYSYHQARAAVRFLESHPSATYEDFRQLRRQGNALLHTNCPSS